MANMSVYGTPLLFEGFLQKRKDTMKMWLTYWFRLQNTTLFFYTKKNGTASHLRGNYYIYTVQSVREVQRADGKHFMFEIIMAKGKRKLLAAETAALRQKWVEHLWRAMHLSTSWVSDSRGTQWSEEEDFSSHYSLDVCEQRERITHREPVMESPPAWPLSAASTHHVHHETAGASPPPSSSQRSVTFCQPITTSFTMTQRRVRRRLRQRWMRTELPFEDTVRSPGFGPEEQLEDRLF